MASALHPLTLERINAMTPQAFLAALGGVFEHSAWIAERAFAARPFASVAALHEAMVDAVRKAPRQQQLALLNAHPELAGREAQAGALTTSSTAEQASAGLNALKRDEMQTLAHWNREYREKFGFPFIIAVRRHMKDSIFKELQRRLASDPQTELDACLDQVYLITRLRLEALVAAL
ncbi:MAG TPA: 2-oxo-4-hydroxy-4-carboxy-5-ureidoimidazoline decarboxylase [Burkholderiales bacterium]|nr:2-oxo-4-hydroxy-4-carboxy-5-ureidoimidazoline decarboxylase [Burkholderiales bacterium]